MIVHHIYMIFYQLTSCHRVTGTAFFQESLGCSIARPPAESMEQASGPFHVS